MSHIRPDVDRVERLERVDALADTNPAAASHSDDHVRVMVPLQACEASRLKFKIAKVKLDHLAALAYQNLPRCAAKIATTMRRELVGLKLNSVPSKIPLETANGRCVVRSDVR